ncbi:MAG TPA: VWA domain-containing protein, partial [Candidatus Binataceae bacterium]
MRTTKRKTAIAAKITCLLAALFLALTASAVFAQQKVPAGPALTLPRSQGTAGATLELPSTAKQDGTTVNIPRNVPQTGQELVIPSRQLREQPGYQQVTVTVTDPNGTYITGLQKDDFKLYMDGQQRPIEFFRQDTNTPVSVGILVDTSGSMQPKISQARAAIAEFLRNLNDRDDIFLFAFSSHPFLLQPFTTNHSLVMGRLGLLHAYGQTALFDTILQGLRMVQHGRYDKKAILVVTDGMDTDSMSRVEDVIALARRTGVLVYSIGIGDPNAQPLTLAIGPFIFGGDIDRVDAQTLKTLSTDTGAKTYIVRQAGDGEALRRACAEISLELREQYTVGFLVPDPKAGGYRNLKVDVPERPAAGVRVRAGVDAGERAAASAWA